MTMRFDIFTLFPEFFDGPFSSSIIGRARESGALQIGLHDMRDYALNKHRRADDAPFGGGAGMVMQAETVALALESVLNFSGDQKPPCKIIYLTPQGRVFNQKIALELAAQKRIALLCGHYEGIDERALQRCVTDEISIGDFVLTGGESAAAMVVEAVSRFVPGVLGNEQSASGDSFSSGLLEAPCYTRPAVWRGAEVPATLLSGHHSEIEKWRFREGLRRTLLRRPELVEIARREFPFSRWQEKIYAELQREIIARETALETEENHDESGHFAPG